MDFQFKIYDPTIIDCSTCHNAVFPDPESQKILLEIILRLCESDVVTRIGEFHFWLNDIEFQSPKIIGTDDYYHDRYREREGEVYSLHTSKMDEINKVSGLYVELKEKALKRIKKKYQQGNYSGFKSVEVHYIEPGLEGVRKVINYAKSLINNEPKDLPPYLKDIELNKFALGSGVIWKIDSDTWIMNDGTYGHINYERCYLGGSCTYSGCEFSFGNPGTGDWDIYNSEYYLDHLNNITKILDDISPSKYMAGPVEMPKMLEFGVMKKEGRKLIPVEESDELRENIMDYGTVEFVEDLDENKVEIWHEKYSDSDDPDRLGYNIHDEPWYAKRVTKMRTVLGERLIKIKKRKDENEIHD